MSCRRDFFHDERGLTTTGMVLSLLITLALLFTAAQVYRINSAAAEVQDVADAAALAAETQVAEFMLVVRYCDAIVLTLTLTGATACALGIAALCTPVTATLSEGLIGAGHRLLSMRDAFASRAAAALNKIQEALPFIAAACAAGVAAANSGISSGSNYLAAAVLVPSKGKTISVDAVGEAQKLLDDIDAQADEIRQKAKEAEEAAEQANRSKERAFKRDCGDNPAYCMFERASHLAELAGFANPLYTNVDVWTFQVALSRAKAYYRARLASEEPANASYKEQARSALRSRFYRYAVEELKGAYVRESADSFEAYFPHLPSNTAAMRLTSLYTDVVYPVSEDALGKRVMHAWPGCPNAAATLELGSISDLESGDFGTCEVCGFSAASMGSVAAASTSIENGFEYHYEAVADEAAVYQESRHRADAPKAEVKSKAGGLLDELAQALKEMVGKRIEASPPGRFGAIAFVVNAGETSSASGFANGFVSGGTLGTRAAVAASTLVDEGTDEGRTALNAALDGLREDGGAAVGAAGIVLDSWSWLLVSYANGQEALTDAIRHGLDALPLVGASGLGTWAAGKVSGAIEDVGLQPAEVGALKPVIVNSGHVAAKGEGSFAAGYVSVKQRIVSHPLMSTDLFASVLTDVERTALEHIDSLGDSVEIASIELGGQGGSSIPITIPLPEPAKAWGAAAVQQLFDRVRSFYVETTGVRVWE